MSTIDTQYQILQSLSQGPTCDVVIAQPKDGTGRVLLKIFKATSENSARVDKRVGFCREMEIATALDHPHIAKPLSTSFEDEVYWIAYPYSEGATLSRRLADGGPVEHLEALRIVGQLLDALDYIHRRGIIHCDINPNNIFVNKDKEIELIDFGLSMLHDDAARMKRERVVGTLPYLSPEQMGLTGLRIDTRSDIYCVGLILYKMLAGGHAFAGTGPARLADLLNQSIKTEVKPIAGAPAILNRILLKALKPSPEDRYQTAAGMLVDIEASIRYVSGESGVECVVGRQDALISVNRSRLFVARFEELAQLQRALQRLMDGKAESCLFYGPSGIGKTEIVRQFRETVDESATPFLAVKCNRFAPSQPYWAFRALMIELSAALLAMPAERRDTFTKLFDTDLYPHSGFVCATAPEMKELFIRIAPIGEVDRERESDRLVHMLSEFLRGLCAAHPFVVFVDDVQWIDRLSLEIFARLLEEQPGSLLIFDYRTESDTGLVVHGRNVTQIGIHSMSQVTPFSRDDMRQLVVSRFGQFVGVDALADTLAAKTDGSPLTVTEACRYVVNAEVLKLGHEGWELDEELLPGLPPRFDTVSLVLGKLDRLGAEEVRFLEIASLVEGKFECDLIARAGAIPRNAAEATARVLEQMGFLGRGLKGGYGFAHDRVQEALRSRVPEQRQTELCEKLGVVCEEMATAQRDFLFAAAEFYARSGNLVKTIEVSFNAAEHAREKIAFDTAVRYYRAALAAISEAQKRGVQSPVEMVKVQMGLGDVLQLTGENDQALEVLGRLVRSSSLSKNEVLSIRLRIGIVNSNMGEFNKAGVLYKEILSEVGIYIPKSSLAIFGMLFIEIVKIYIGTVSMRARSGWYSELIGESMNRLAHALYFDNAVEAMVYCFRSANYFARRVNCPEKTIAVAHVGLAYHIFRRHRRSKRAFQEATRSSIASGRRDCEASTILIESMAGYMSAKWKLTLQGLNKGIWINKEIGNVSDQIIHCEHLWRIELMLGNLSKARLYIDETISICDRTHEKHFRMASLAALVYVEAMMTGVINAQQVSALSEVVDKTPEFLSKSHVEIMLVAAEMVVENYSSAYRRTDTLFPTVLQKTPFTEYTVPALTYACELAIIAMRKKRSQDGPSDIPQNAAKGFRRNLFLLWLNSLCYPAHRGSYYRIRAWQSVLRHRHRRAIKLFTRALREFHTLDMRYEEARTFRDYGEFLSEINRPGESREKYNEAYKLFTVCGAHYEAKKIQSLVDESLVRSSAVEKIRDRSIAASISSEIEHIRVDSLHKLCASMSEVEDLDLLCRQILMGTITATGAQFGYLLTEAYDVLDARRIGLSHDGSTFALSKSYLFQNILDKVRRNRVSIVTGTSVSLASTPLPEVLRSVCCVPLCRGEKYLGCIYLGSAAITGLFSESSRKVAEIIAAQAGIVLENAFLMNRYRRLNVELERKVNEQTQSIQQKNRQLEESTIRLTENERMRAILSNTLVHDIKNQIMPMAMGAASSKAKMNDPEALRRYFDLVKSSCKDITGMASNILDIERIEEGRMPLTREHIPAATVCEMVAEMAKDPAFEARGITVIVPSPSSAEVFADAYLLKRVLGNLMANAAKYSSDRGTVELTFEQSSTETAIHLFSSGEPILREYCEVIFDKYSQLGDNRSQVSKGLGLFFCKMVMHAHKGRIWAQPRESGNCFGLAFPSASGAVSQA